MLDTLICLRDFKDKIDVPNLVTYLNQTPTFGWYVEWCASKICV